MEDLDIGKEIEALRATLRQLRGENGCPWDREQSLDDAISYLIDEAYELLQAEKSSNPVHIEEELGDVFYLVIFIHELLLEKRQTNLSKIVNNVRKKLINRHPHVFGGASASDRKESIAEWERMKQKERSSHTADSILASIPANLPPIRKAAAAQKQAAGTGFDWPDHDGVIDKIHEEIEELKSAIDSGQQSKIKGEIGDLLFTVINLARKLLVDSESALETSTAKFIRRFNIMEEKVRASGLPLNSLSIDELEQLWQDSKE